MTYKQRYQLEHPNSPMQAIDDTPYACPEDTYGTSCPREGITCKECWDRRIDATSDDGQILVAVMIITVVLAILTAGVYLIWGW